MENLLLSYSFENPIDANGIESVDIFRFQLSSEKNKLKKNNKKEN